ncbi:MAG TPA: HAMP domain-containing sensor histidine kinase [Gammaproteobacteria bacterium]|nr:HAMP domain-containing sensor histidine kinase [Gammaproteobacteria bacterium]
MAQSGGHKALPMLRHRLGLEPGKARLILRRDPSKALLVGFLTLLVISMLQVGYWVTENLHYAHSVEQRLAAEYRADAEVVGSFLAGRVPDAVNRLMPHLAIDTATKAVSVRPEALETLARVRAERVNRYLWEGSFFIAVLIGGMAVLTRTIRHDAELRRRQQNFLAAVSHEFKSPIASVRLAAETLLLRADSPDTQKLARRILDDGERLLRMVENLLDTTRLEEGRRRLEPAAIDVRAAAAASIAEVAERAASHGIDVDLRVEEGLRLVVDPHALETILRNLLDNAIKACAAGDGKQIAVHAVRRDGRIELSVSDDGLGFPPEDAAMIFEKFHRLGDELRRSMAGTGLGLYIVKRLAELSGGSVGAASAGLGRGAVFTLVWPERAAR